MIVVKPDKTATIASRDTDESYHFNFATTLERYLLVFKECSAAKVFEFLGNTTLIMEL